MRFLGSGALYTNACNKYRTVVLLIELYVPGSAMLSDLPNCNCFDTSQGLT